MTTTNPDSAGIANLPAALDLAAFEQLPGGLFQPIGALPAWFGAPLTDEIDLGDRFAMLEMFLPAWERDWHGTSDLWSEPDGKGGEQYLQAVATASGGRRFLVVKTLPQDLYKYQQLAHDFELEKGKVERLSRELEKKREEAERATQAKSEFLARMSHEIRTPLNAVIGMADVLSSTSLTADQRRCVEVSQRNGIGLLNLINDILDLSKVEAGKVELEAAEMDLRDVIARAMEVVETRSSAKALWLRQTIGPGVPVLLVGDPNRLRQVLINLLGNSIKFTEQGGLDIKVEPDPEAQAPGRLRFAVSDTGIGIPADKVSTVFESFSQADTSTTRKYGGTGLGLTISKELVELMGGRIWVESALGQGSTFYFTASFGVQDKQPECAAHAAAQPRAEQKLPVAELELRTEGMRILLADDSEDNRFLILSYLKRTGSTVDIAENGAEAVACFLAGRYDVILMDVEMPVMDGYTATREIRALEMASAKPPTPILALTAHAFADMAGKGFAAGFTDLLTKPIRSVTLLEALDKHRGHAIPALPTVRIQIEEGMEDVVPGYLVKRKADVPLYRDALAAADMKGIRMMAHRMKGTGAGYGFQVLTDLGGALEKAALRAESGEGAAEVMTILDELARYLDSVVLEYNPGS